ncbi:CPBP family glutamic-type intramembrane protease [Peptococcaceae bacterium 1198_IL3148]
MSIKSINWGIGLALIYYWTGSLIPGIIAHSFVNSARLILVYLS